MTYSFAADRTLGKLAKWLRILGFDTIFESDYAGRTFYDRLGPDRVLLTRIVEMRDRFDARKLIFIRSDRVFEQLGQVVAELALTRADIQLFSRCLPCNLPIEAVDKHAIYGRVPDYVWENHDAFNQCRQCKRIYWAGSHGERSREVVEGLFQMTNDEGRRTN